MPQTVATGLDIEGVGRLEEWNDQRRSHVVSRGLPDCTAPACRPSVSFANPPSRRSEPETPPLWCMARWSVPACLAALQGGRFERSVFFCFLNYCWGTESWVEASAQLSLLLCIEGGNSRSRNDGERASQPATFAVFMPPWLRRPTLVLLGCLWLATGHALQLAACRVGRTS